MAKQSLRTAVRLTQRERAYQRAANYMEGLPVGGWAETKQGERQVSEELPFRADRSYTVDDFIFAVYRVDSAGRYRRR